MGRDDRMTLESLISTYGYGAILVGTFVEGETVLVLGGFAAHRGYLELPWVILAAFVGSLCGDQLFFFLGRRHSHFILERRPAFKGKMERANRLITRFQTPLILGFRFLYGLRTVMPFALGVSAVPVVQFVVLNAIGALVWAIGVAVGGYLFGTALELVIGDLKHYEFRLFGAIAITGMVIWALYFYRGYRSQKE
jgi:membrane protein DedA with SNARE-associated domain